MAEYIDRDAAFNTILHLVPKIDDDGYCWVIRGDAAIAIDSIPAADVRPVVLCRDCKWTNTDEVEDPAIYCWKWDRWEMPPDEFCWLGKKREES